MKSPWRRRTRRAYNPTGFREADATVARLMRGLRERFEGAGLVYQGITGKGGKWIAKQTKGGSDV